MPEEDLSTKIQIAQVAHLAEELAGKQGELSAGPGISISRGVVSVLADGETIGFDPDGKLASLQSAPEYSAGGGIVISDGEVSVKADGSTISTNASGELQCLVSGGPTYSAGSGINIVDGGISIASTALQDVKQVISSGAVVRGGSDGSGGYFFVTGSGATMGYGSGFRISVGASETTVKTNTSTGLYLSGNSVTLKNAGKTHYKAGANVVVLYGSTSAIALQLGSTAVGIKHSGDANYKRVVHMGMSATSDTPGVIQPDNSTCFVTSGGILHVPGASPGAAIPVLTWHVYDGTGVVSVPEAVGGFLNEVLANGVLLEPGEDYAYDSGSQVVSLYAQISSGGKVTTKVYPGEVAFQEEPVRGMRSIPVPDCDDFFVSDPDVEDEGGEES